jgi:DNA-binding transcriptional ArsR family regulator
LKQGETDGEAGAPSTLSAAKLAHVLSHPRRVELLALLEKREASSPMLLDQVDAEVSLNVISYHLAVLDDYGCLELVRTVPKGGANEYFYRAKPDLLLDPLYLEMRSAAGPS